MVNKSLITKGEAGVHIGVDNRVEEALRGIRVDVGTKVIGTGTFLRSLGAAIPPIYNGFHCIIESLACSMNLILGGIIGRRVDPIGEEDCDNLTLGVITDFCASVTGMRKGSRREIPTAPTCERYIRTGLFTR